MKNKKKVEERKKKKQKRMTERASLLTPPNGSKDSTRRINTGNKVIHDSTLKFLPTLN